MQLVTTISHSRRAQLVIALVVAAGVLVIGMTVVSSSGHAARQTASRGPGSSFSFSQPLIGGQPVTQQAASAALTVPLPLPAPSAVSSAATAPDLTQAVATDDSGAKETYIAASYPNASVVVEYENPVPYSDPLSYYQTYVAQTPSNLSGLASIGTVGNHPALILAEDADATGSNPGSIEFATDGLKVAVIGDVSQAKLQSIADSVNASAAATS